MSQDPSTNQNDIADISFYQPEMMEMESGDPQDDDHGNNALMDRTTQENNVNHDDGMMVEHQHQGAASKNNDDNHDNQHGNDQHGNGTKQDSEFDAITRDAALLLEKKLANTKGWAKKLLQEITVYVETVEQAQTEYVRVQRLEHEESNRLDQVEPEVHGATTFSHSYNGGGGGGDGQHQTVPSYPQHGAPNEYLDDHDDNNVDTENMGPSPSHG